MSGPNSVAALLADLRLPRLEQRLLLEFASGLDHAAMVRAPEAVLSAAVLEKFQHLLARRLAGEPIAHILGVREFYGRTFQVDQRVLIPRPETELLIELALDKAGNTPNLRLLDVGTGSGCIAITMALERSDCAVTAIDVSADALDLARINARRLAATVAFAQIDVAGASTQQTLGGPFDLILGNLPYIADGDPHLLTGDLRFEPVQALTDGKDGLSLIEATIHLGRAALAKSGWILLEHGYDQATRVRDMLTGCAFRQVATYRDLAGIERVTVGLQGG